MKDVGVIFKIQKYSIHDGPGIRTVVFLKGCPLRCIWCCNPESWNPHPEIMRVPTSLSKARELVGKYMKVQDVMKLLEQDEPFYKVSGGGITLSGGEPTVQPEFSNELLKECKKRGLHTAVETSGFCEWKKLSELGEFVDLFLYDIKVLNGEKHSLFTGVPNDLILKNLKKLAKLRKNIVIRYPLIPEHNDGNEDIDALIDLVVELNSKDDIIDEIDLLPYHRYGFYKYELLGIDYKLKSLAVPTKDKVNEIKKKLSEALCIKIKVCG